MHGTVKERYDELMETGVTKIEGGFPDGMVQQVLEGLHKFIDKNDHLFGNHRDELGHYPRVVNLHLAFKPMLKLFTENPTSLAVQDAFFGKPASIYTSLYFENGTGQPIHRDTPVFSTKPEYQYLGVWVALEEANEMNGPLMVIRGGHKVPELDREALALQKYGNLESIQKMDNELWMLYQDTVHKKCLERGLKVEEISANPGDVIIWHPQLPHGGSEIKDTKLSRESVVMHTTPVGVPVYHQDVFFNPKKLVPEKAPWVYIDHGDRKYASHEYVDFAHKDPHRPNEFITA